MKVAVAGRTVDVSNLDRVLWPRVGATKADLVRHVTAMADVMLPHVRGHPLTLHRFPEGVGGPHFFQTRAPAHPPWVRAVRLRTPKLGKEFDVVVLDDLAALVWSANIAAIELHPYLGTADDFERPTQLVFDLDPGAPADLLDCCDVALALRTLLDDLGLRSWPNVSGGKGLHVRVPIEDDGGFPRTKQVARAIAELLREQLPERVVTVMAREHRGGRVFIDWSQNDPWKSIVALYSARGLSYPTVAAPVSWEEVERAATARDLRPLLFLIDDMPGRLDAVGDLSAGMREAHQRLPAA